MSVPTPTPKVIQAHNGNNGGSLSSLFEPVVGGGTVGPVGNGVGSPVGLNIVVGLKLIVGTGRIVGLEACEVGEKVPGFTFGASVGATVPGNISGAEVG